MNYIWFWLAKFVAEMAFAALVLLILFIVCVLIALWMQIPIWVKQYHCKHPHEQSYETTKCDVRCRQCGKNLGFIGSLKE